MGIWQHPRILWMGPQAVGRQDGQGGPECGAWTRGTSCPQVRRTCPHPDEARMAPLPLPVGSRHLDTLRGLQGTASGPD